MPRVSSARNSTTVLATESAKPNTKAPPKPQPHQVAKAMPSAVATIICTTAPGTAILRTASRSPHEKCRPTPNINNITPISANWLAIAASATKPGVYGPMTTPASRYPINAGNRNRVATKPNARASPSAAAMVCMSVTLCGMVRAGWGNALAGR